MNGCDGLYMLVPIFTSAYMDCIPRRISISQYHKPYQHSGCFIVVEASCPAMCHGANMGTRDVSRTADC